MTQFPSAAQPWLNNIPVMQQSVLFSAIRGPDGFAKSHPVKPLLRFYRRCVLISAFDGVALTNPYSEGGGSFTGPSLNLHPDFGLLGRDASGPEGDGWWPNANDWPFAMQVVVDRFLNCRDEYNLHYWGHAMHAFQILGVHHPIPKIRSFWDHVYQRMVNAQHLLPEPADELNRRLSDSKSEWSLKDEGDGYRL